MRSWAQEDARTLFIAAKRGFTRPWVGVGRRSMAADMVMAWRSFHAGAAWMRVYEAPCPKPRSSTVVVNGVPMLEEW